MANQFPRVIKFTIFYLVSLSFSKQAFTQINVNYTCNEKVLMWYEKNVYPIDSINNEVFEVFFNSGFKDSAIVYINGTELFSGYLITDPRLSFARNLSFANKNNEDVYLRIYQFDKCLVVPIDKHYKYISISWSNQAWALQYSNTKPLYE